mgnify:CR=1 FL=1
MFFCWLQTSAIFSQEIETVERITSSRSISGYTDLHILSDSNPIEDGVTVNLTSPDVFLFFDNIKPNTVIKDLKSKILINGKSLDPKTNCRVVVYRQGSVLMAHSPQFCPLKTFTETSQEGEETEYTSDIYYTNNPDPHTLENMVRPLKHDNKIRSFILKRGYSATFANEPDGMGYSRVFIADNHDLVVDMPEELDRKVSFIRICKWQYPSKKGWAGSVWSSAPNGLQYVTEQCEFTNSTWFYNWGTSTSKTTNPSATDSTYNQEFVPEKWGAGEATQKLLSLCHASHLLGYNEPDHTEQSNVSVEKAIEEWPQLLRTGLRLGSPATTNFSWLYSFMTEARKKNYRVDYVVIHAYWGGLSGDQWYDKLKEIHDRTGCPIWIKEWNNGANWTNEGWPSGTEAQQQKQLNDLKSILTVLDTCSFVERYSIYNWVQDKRAIILNGKLTPAGEYYASDQPDYFLNRDKEVTPVWRIREAPVFSYTGYDEKTGALFRWTDKNGEMIPFYQFEKSTDGKTFETLATIPYSDNLQAYDNPQATPGTERTYYRVSSLPKDDSGKASNMVCVNHINNMESESSIHVQDIFINENWSLSKFVRQYDDMDDSPFVLLGIPTYRNKMPLTHRLSNVTNQKFDVQLSPWIYQENPQLTNPDTIAIMAMYDNMTPDFMRTKIVNVGQEWQHVDFDKPFDNRPVVLTSIIANYATQPMAVRIRNVDTHGFDVRMATEEKSSSDTGTTKLSVLAVEPGIHTYNNWEFVVGVTPDNAVGSSLTGGYVIQTEGSNNTSAPFFFAEMQSSNDELASTLRIRSRTLNDVTVIKDREKSSTHNDPEKETVGWMAVFQKTEADGINTPYVNSQNNMVFYSLDGIKQSGYPTKKGIYISIDALGKVKKVVF